MRNFKTYDLAVTFYRMAKRLPCESHLKDQLNRASASIVLNLAEGTGRGTKADQKRFFDIALGSLRECQAIIDLTQEATSEPYKVCDSLGAHLYKLIKSCTK